MNEKDTQEKDPKEKDAQGYEAPSVERVETEDDPAVTAAQALSGAGPM